MKVYLLLILVTAATASSAFGGEKVKEIEMGRKPASGPGKYYCMIENDVKNATDTLNNACNPILPHSIAVTPNGRMLFCCIAKQ